jgi:hypothetical protein
VGVSSSGLVCHTLPQSSHTMNTHPNTELTALDRERVVRRHIDERISVAELASQAEIRLRTTYKWLARFRSGGAASLIGRHSWPGHCAMSVARCGASPKTWQNLSPASIIGSSPWGSGVYGGGFQERCHTSATLQAACINGSCSGSSSSSGG